MSDTASAPVKPKTPADHPAAIVVAVLSASALVAVTAAFAMHFLVLGDAIFGWICSSLCLMSACGHIFDDGVDQAGIRAEASGTQPEKQG